MEVAQYFSGPFSRARRTVLFAVYLLILFLFCDMTVAAAAENFSQETYTQ